VGRDRHIERYRALAARHGVAQRVTLAGPQHDPKPYFGAADAFVLPTLYDPFPNAALEAMACGLPVVTSTKSGAAELVVPVGAGFACPSGDAPALAGPMRTLLDADTRGRMGRIAREAVLPLTPDAMTLELVLLYKELLESSARQQRNDTERKLAAHRRAWKAKVGTAVDEPVGTAPAATEPPPDAHDAAPGSDVGDRAPKPPG
jgi:glycogen synthase